MKSRADFQLDTETILPKYIELWIPKTSSDRNSGIILKPFFHYKDVFTPQMAILSIVYEVNISTVHNFVVAMLNVL